MALGFLIALALRSAIPLVGTVEDADGRPAAGASVWLGDTNAQAPWPETIATARTDASGRFRLNRPIGMSGRGVFWSPTLWAYRPGSRVAHREFNRAVPGAGESIRLVLGRPASAALRITRPDGTPAAGARVVPVTLAIRAPRPPDAMTAQLGVTADADGRANLDGLDRDDLIAVDVTDGAGLVQSLPIDEDSGEVVLLSVGTLQVRVVSGDPGAVRGWTIEASSHPAWRLRRRGPGTTHRAEATTDADGRATFPPLAVGRIDWEIRPPEGSTYLIAERENATIRAGLFTQVEFRAIPGVRVEGVVRGDPAGAPVPGFTFDLNPLGPSFGRPGRIKTDDRGRFSALVPPGKVRFSVPGGGFPDSSLSPYISPAWVDFEVAEGETRHEFDPPRLKRGAVVRGRVIDEAGRPAPWVLITGGWTRSPSGTIEAGRLGMRSDDRGAIVKGGVPPGVTLDCQADDRGFESDRFRLSIPAEGDAVPFTLKVRRRPLVGLSGRVVGGDGRPIAGASIRVWFRTVTDSGGGSGEIPFEGEPIRTGPDGRYETPGTLSIRDGYQIRAEARGWEPSASGWIAATTAGPAIVAIPDLVSRRRVGLREVTGRVVDSAGAGVAGVEVFQAGDGPNRTETATDATGRFRLPGVRDAPAFVFATKGGHRFTGRRVDPGDRDVTIALRRDDEPPMTRLGLAPPAVGRDEERAIARALADEARRVAASVPDGLSRQMHEALAIADPDGTVARIEAQAIEARPELLLGLALARSERGLPAVFEVGDAIESREAAAFVLLGVFDRLGATLAPPLRRDLLERAETAARRAGEPGQVALVADRWLDLGEPDRASRLAAEARRPDPPRIERYPFNVPRVETPVTLCRFDLPGALALVEGQAQDRPSQDRYRAEIAVRIAATDPTTARRLVDQIEPRGRWSARRDVALRVAATDLATAEGIAAEAEGTSAVVAPILPAIAARARSGTDPAGARALLAGSVDRLRNVVVPEGDRGPSAASAMARLLPIALRVDPDRAPEILWRALALRPPLTVVPEPSPVPIEVRAHYLDLAELAAVVARYDRGAAEVVLGPFADRVAGLDDDTWGLDFHGPALFRAAGIFDGRLARTLVEALPDDPAPSAGRPRRNVRSKRDARLALAETLGLPPALRRLGRSYLPREVTWLDLLDD